MLAHCQIKTSAISVTASKKITTLNVVVKNLFVERINGALPTILLPIETRPIFIDEVVINTVAEQKCTPA